MNVKRMLQAACVAATFVVATTMITSDAGAQQVRLSFGGGGGHAGHHGDVHLGHGGGVHWGGGVYPGGVYPGGVYPGGQWGGGTYGGYWGGGGVVYPGSTVWHDTTHLDWHPGQWVPHNGHLDYQPGHYDVHQSGHYDYTPHFPH